MRILGVAVALCLGTAVASADDRWEFVNGFGHTDDARPTNNGLTHGTTQLHDLQGTADPDVGFVTQRAYRSYEARVVDTNHCWNASGSGGCHSFNRIDGTNAVVQPGISFDGLNDNFITLRWETDNAPDPFAWTRVIGNGVRGALDSQYELQFYDTTYTVPRWNNSNGQITVFLIQAAQGRAVSGNIRFFNAAGALLATAPLSVPATGLQVLSTTGVAGLANQSGSAVITHNGGYGGLAGKAVALEAATGFSFDTQITAIPLPR